MKKMRFPDCNFKPFLRRRMGVLLAVVLCFAPLLSACSNTQTNSAPPVTKTGFYLDTVISVTLYPDTISARADEPNPAETNSANAGITGEPAGDIATYANNKNTSTNTSANNVNNATALTNAYIDECFALCEHYENLFSNTIATSDISRINAAPDTAVEVDAETIELLNIAREYGELTNGAFDVTIGQLSSLWDFDKNSTADVPQIPDKDAIELARESVDYRQIEIDEENKTVTLHTNTATTGATGNPSENAISKANQIAPASKTTTDKAAPAPQLDLGGIAKGYIADKMKAYLNATGVTSGVINLGGNVLTIGEKMSGEPYKIGLQKPFSETGEVLAAVELRDGSVVTSGTYQRYFKTNDGTLYHHILDPKTGYPVETDGENALNAVTVITKNSVDGDALSTYLFTLGLKNGLNKAETLEESGNIEGAIFITTDNKIHATPRAEKMLAQ